jgi:ubiquinone/menaquinone biosynthesis C-methylase UbiE
MKQIDDAPNHHADHRGFSGVYGILAALTMIAGRGGDARLAIRQSALGAGDVVVDIGCGPGAAAREAAKVGATVIGVDPAPVMLRIASLLTWPRAKVQYTRGAAESLPVADDAATVVWSIATVHHWRDVDAGLDEVGRVLRGGGRFVAIERRTHDGAHGLASHGWTDEQAAAFADCCRDHGFSDVKVDTVAGKKKSVVCVTATA